MDKSDLILEKLNSMEKALRTENKTLNDKMDKLTENQEMFWQVLMETRQDIKEIINVTTTDNNLKINYR